MAQLAQLNFEDGNMTEIKKKTDYQHIRLRVPMYLGSPDPHTQQIISYDNGQPVLAEMTWVPALYTGFREIVDNALDEVVGHGFGNRIDITYNEKDLIFSVKDNGRGIPITYDEEHQMYAATMALTEPKAGRNFEERGAVAGTNGIGASATNITAEYFNFEIVRDGKKFKQRCTEGNVVLGDYLQIFDPEITKSASSSYTYIEYKPSREVYKHRILPEQFVKDRLYEIAVANPDIKISYNGEVIKVKLRPEQNLFPNKKPIIIEHHNENMRVKFWLLPEWSKENEFMTTIVNNINAFNGGVHMETFRRSFLTNFLNSLTKESKRRKLQPNRSDVTEGLLIYNITVMNAPNFDSQSKTRLINEEVEKELKKAFDDEALYKNIIKKNPEWIEAIFERCARRTMKKDASEIEKIAKKNSRLKIAKLMDATGKDRSKCILLLGEGDSAIAGAAAVRDPEIHGGLPLRGKVLNVTGEDLKKVVNNAELINITTSLGLVIGQKADRENMRYGQVYIATDSDEDGKNIAALLVNFFNTFWPELLEDTEKPFLNIFQTPFIIMEKGKQRQYVYAHNYSEFDPKDYSGWQIIRAKGLGTLEEVDWKYALDNPLLFPIIKDENLNDTLDLIFNEKRADDRKEWIGM